MDVALFVHQPRDLVAPGVETQLVMDVWVHLCNVLLMWIYDSTEWDDNDAEAQHIYDTSKGMSNVIENHKCTISRSGYVSFPQMATAFSSHILIIAPLGNFQGI